jgi:hypothetical protein
MQRYRESIRAISTNEENDTQSREVRDSFSSVKCSECGVFFIAER